MREIIIPYRYIDIRYRYVGHNGYVLVMVLQVGLNKSLLLLFIFFFSHYERKGTKMAKVLKILNLCQDCLFSNDSIFYLLSTERESQEDARVVEVTEDLLPPAKVPLFPRDHINSKKAQAMRKDRKRQQAKLRTMIYADHPPLALDKHQPEFVSSTATKTTSRLLKSLY